MNVVAQSEATTIRRETAPGISAVRIVSPAYQELYLSLFPIPGENVSKMISRLAEALKACDAVIVRHEVFGSLSARAETIQALEGEFENVDWPITWVEGAAAAAVPVEGMHLFAIAGIPVETLYEDGRPIGRTFDDGDFRHCLLGDLRPTKLDVSKGEQSLEVFEQLERMLGAVNMDMSHVMRTWFFLEDLLAWYGTFNEVRNKFYGEKKMSNGFMPASTGIGGRNPGGGAIVAGAWAVSATGPHATVREIASPLQCSATNYGSAFSRAIVLESPGAKKIMVSGTASIDPDGRSVRIGDLAGQLETSFDVVKAILISEGFGFDDVSRATGYFKPGQDGSQCRSDLRWLGMPGLRVHADICRPELLFEIELDAVLSAPGNFRKA